MLRFGTPVAVCTSWLPIGGRSVPRASRAASIEVWTRVPREVVLIHVNRLMRERGDVADKTDDGFGWSLKRRMEVKRLTLSGAGRVQATLRLKKDTRRQQT